MGANKKVTCPETYCKKQYFSPFPAGSLTTPTEECEKERGGEGVRGRVSDGARGRWSERAKERESESESERVYQRQPHMRANIN